MHWRGFLILVVMGLLAAFRLHGLLRNDGLAKPPVISKEETDKAVTWAQGKAPELAAKAHELAEKKAAELLEVAQEAKRQVENQ